MKKLLLTTSLLLVAACGSAFAQNGVPITRSPAMPLLVAPPMGTLSTTETKHITAPDGTTTDKTETTYRDTDGVANQSETHVTTPAPTAIDTTTSNSTTTTTVVTPVPWDHSCPAHNHYDAKTDSCVF